MKEEAKRRDHRLLLGKKLDLFSIQEDAGGGLVFWHPGGAMMRHIIEGYWVDKHINSATHPYELVGSPHIAKQELWTAFRASLKTLPPGTVTEEDINNNQEFINKHLRLSEELQKHSSSAQMVLITLPQQYIGTTHPAIYMAAVDFMTRNLPSTVLVGGNNVSVLTSFT